MEAPAASKLTCAHKDCNCEVQIVTPCGCSGTGEYRCHCGAPLVTAS
jgi:hypothetical protein